MISKHRHENNLYNLRNLWFIKENTHKILLFQRKVVILHPKLQIVKNKA